MTSNELSLLFELAKNKGCKFTTLTYTSNETGEVARHSLLFGVDYKTALERDEKYLKRLVSVIGNRYYKSPTDQHTINYEAAVQLLESTQKSLAKYDGDNLSKEAKEKDTYTAIAPGLKMHKDTGVLYLWALAIRKTVITPGKVGSSKVVNSKPLTLAKDRIRSKLRSNQYRNFRLDRISSAKLNGNTLVIE